MAGILGALGAGAIGGAGVAIVISAVDNFSKTYAKAQTGLAGFGTAAGVAVVAGAALAGGMVLLAKKAGEVETGYAKVNTLLEEGQDAQKAFKDTVEDLNVAMGNQGNQLDVLAGLYNTISAGITDTADAQIFMTAASKAAVGGSAELNTVILAGTKAMAGFGLGVEDSNKIFDVFAGTVKAGQTTMGELAGAFPKIAGVAGEMGMELEETAGIFAGLTKVMESSDEVATSMTAILTGLLKPSTEMQEAFKILGYESGQAMVQELGLMKTLEALKGTTDGSAEALGGLFGNLKALRGVMPALGTAADDVAASIDIVKNSTGLANKQYEDMTNTLEFKWGVAMSEAQNVTTDMGMIIKEILLPILELLTGAIGVVADLWSNLSEGQKKIIVIMTGLTAVLAIVTGAVVLLTIATTAFTAVNIWWIAGIMAVILAIGLIIAIIANWSKIVDWAKEKIAILTDYLKDKFKNEIELVNKAIEILGNTFTWLKDSILTPVWDTFKSIYTWLKDKFLGVIGSVIDKIKSVISLAKKVGGGIASVAANVLGSRETGGYIPQTGLYNLHQGEYVVPKKDVKSGGSSTIININNLNGFNARDIANQLQDELNKKI